MKNLIPTISAILGIVLLTSCSKDMNNGALTLPQVSSMLRANNSSSTLNSINKDSLVWNAGKAHSTKVKFEAEKAGSEIEFRSNDRLIIDLFSATALAGNLTIPAGNYDEVEIRTLLEPSASQPSLELKGNFTSNGVAIPIIFQSFESLEVKSEKNNVTIDPGSNYNLTTLIDLNLILTGISASDLAKATRVNGEIMITSSVNSNLYRKMVENLKNLEDECEIHRH